MNILRKGSRFARSLPLLLGLVAMPAMADTVNCYVVTGTAAGNGDAGVTTDGGIFFGVSQTSVGSTTAISFGGTAASEPSAVTGGTFNTGVMYVRGGNSELWEVSALNGGTWTSLGGQITWNPFAVRVGSDTMVLYRGTNQAIWYREKVNGVWGPHTSIAGVATSSPVAVSWGSGHVAVFKRGQSNDLWYRERIAGVWGAWTGLGGNFTVDPVVVARAYGYYDVFVREGSNVKWINYNGVWNGWVNIDSPPGGAVSEPGAAGINGVGLAVFVRGGNVSVNGANWRPIYKRRTLDGGISWTGWELVQYQFPGSASNPEAASYGSGYVVAAANAGSSGTQMEYCTGTGS